MRDQLLSLSAFFNQSIFRIPDYQRGYAWGEKEYTDFWHDIRDASDIHSYYMGVITVDEIPSETLHERSWKKLDWLINNQGYSPFYVVDGQQRLTTIILLLSCIIEYKAKLEENVINFATLESIRESFLFKNKSGTDIYSELFNYEDENSSSAFFRKRILGLSVQDPQQEVMNKYNQNLLDAQEFFKNQLTTLPSNEIENLFKKITTKIVFNKYQISRDIDVFITFETMNNRGKNLSTLELLKNRLIYLSSLSTDEISVQSDIRSAINYCWKKVYDYLGRNPNNLLSDDDFLITHTQMYFRGLPEDISEEITTYLNRSRYFAQHKVTRQFLLNSYFTVSRLRNGQLTISDIHNYIDSLISSINTWYVMNNPQLRIAYRESDIGFDDDIKELFFKFISLFQIRSGLYLQERYEQLNWKLIVMCFFAREEDHDMRIKFLNKLEKYIFVQLLCFGYESYAFINATSKDEIVDFIFKSTNSSEVIEKLKSITEKLLSNEELKKSLMKVADSNSKRGAYLNRSYFPVMYILQEYLVDRNNKAKQPLSFDDKVSLYLGDTTLEHIFPQNVRGTNWNSKFTKNTTTEKNKIKHSFGNLIAMSASKNEKIGNKNFEDKKIHGNVGYLHGFVDEKEVAENDQWTYAEILNRGYTIMDFIHNNWGIKFVNKEEKRKLMGLGSIKNH